MTRQTPPSANPWSHGLIEDNILAYYRGIARRLDGRFSEDEQVAWFTTGRRRLLRFNAVLRTVADSPEEVRRLADPILDVFLSQNLPFFWAVWPPGDAPGLAEYLSATGLPFEHFHMPAMTRRLDDLPGSTQGRMRVIANDGFLTGQDDSDSAFTVPDAPPEAMILEPVDGAVAPIGALVVFSGLGMDVTDGPLGENSLRWRSDRDGPLGTGKEVTTTTLSPGLHRITLIATDSNGHTGDETITVYIGNRLYLPTLLR